MLGLKLVLLITNTGKQSLMAMPCWGVRSLSFYGSSDPVGEMYSSSVWHLPATEELGGNWTSIAELDWTKGCPKAGHHMLSTEGCYFRSGWASWWWWWSNCIVCHLFYILCVSIIFPSCSVLLICVYLNLWVLTFFLFLLLTEEWAQSCVILSFLPGSTMPPEYSGYK